MSFGTGRSGRAAQLLSGGTQMRLGQRFRLLRIGLVQLAVDLAVGHPIPVATLLALLASCELTQRMPEGDTRIVELSVRDEWRLAGHCRSWRCSDAFRR